MSEPRGAVLAPVISRKYQLTGLRNTTAPEFATCPGNVPPHLNLQGSTALVYRCPGVTEEEWQLSANFSPMAATLLFYFVKT